MKKQWIAALMAVFMLFGSVSGFAVAFSDVGEAHTWAKAEIESYAERGILAGDGKGSFFPDNSVTRAEFAKMLCLVFGLEEAAGLAYSDVDEDSWQYEYIAKTDKYTYTEGEESYAPDKEATRAEIAYAIVNAAGFEVKEISLPFADAGEIEDALAANAKTAYALELLKGYPDNTFRPNAPVTRAEAVVLLARAEAALAAQPEEKPLQPSVPETPPAEEEEKQEEEKPASVKVMPMETLCYIESVREAIDPSDDEMRMRLRFYVSGNQNLQMLYAEKNTPVFGTDGTPTTLRAGDVVCIGTNLYGKVKQIRVVLRMGARPILNKPTSGVDVFKAKLYVSTADKWGYLEEGKKQEVWLGFLGELTYDGDMAKVYIYPANGKKNADNLRVLVLPSDTPVLTYTTKSSAKTRYGFTTLDSVEYYGAEKDQYGNITWVSVADADYYQYVFVKTKNDVVTDLVIISNQ